MSERSESFAKRYGPWALVLGASDGVGAAYARAVAVDLAQSGAMDAIAAGTAGRGMPRNDAVRLMAEHGGALMTTPLEG